MKALALPLLYALFILIGLIACGALAWVKRERAAWIAAAIFFGGPLGLHGYLTINAEWELKQFHADVAYVKELCAKYGGDKIYRTVDNVEGVFQMRARNPDQDFQLRDQFGVFDQWGYAQDDRANPGLPIGYSNKSYRYLEMQPGYGQPQGPPYRRKLGVDTGRKIGDANPNALPERRDEAIWEYKNFEVGKLRSRYGYITEDLSTPEMRKHWIAGGRIKIVDLQTNEVLAERVGYFRAIGTHAQDRWSGASDHWSAS